MRERDLESAGGQEERDGIGAILEEVINRYESKIDLFCSSSREDERCPRARAHSSTYDLSHPPVVLGDRYRGGVGARGGRGVREHLSRGNLREIYRLRRVCEFEISPIRIAPPVARNPRRSSSPFPLLPLPSSDDLAGHPPPPRGGEKLRDLYRTRGRRTPKGRTTAILTTNRPMIKIRWIILEVLHFCAFASPPGYR